MKNLNGLLPVALAALFIAHPALAQTSGTVTSRAFAIGKGAGQTGFASVLCTQAQIAIGQSAANPICAALSGDVTMTATGVTAIGTTKVTSAMLNADVYSTAHTWGGQQTFVAPILGTPASGTLTNATGLPIATGVSGLGAGCATFLGTPSSANLRGCLTDEVGTGAFYTVGGALGTPASGTATNLTGVASGLTAGTVTTNANLTGDVTSVGNAATINLGITPTWTGAHTFNNGTFSALFSGGPVGINNAGPTAPLHVGGVAAASSGSNILSARNSTGATSVHGFAENSTINLSANGQGMDSYDARMVVSGTATYDHFVSYQSRPIYGSAGVATWGYGVWDQITANGPITNTASYYASNPVGSSTITNAYGFYSEAIAKGGTLNYAFFSAGSTPSKFGGNVDVGSLSIAGTDATAAWSAWTPTITSTGGTITTSSTVYARYKQIGKIVTFQAQITITTNGTGSGSVRVTLPVTARSTTNFSFSGVRSGTISLNGITASTTTVDWQDYNAVYPGADGRSLYIHGTYEAA